MTKIPYVVLRSHDKETRLVALTAHFFPIKLTQCVTTILDDCTQVWSMSNLCSSAWLCQVSWKVCSGHTVLYLCVGNCAMLLSKMQS